MKLTCSQMEILISFYIEDELSSCLKNQVEEHLSECEKCSAKYEIVKKMIEEMKASVAANASNRITENELEQTTNSEQYKIFKTNLSAYLDNELTNDENVKIKKFTINNKLARKELEDSYKIRKMMTDSFEKTMSDTKQDFSKTVMSRLEIDDYASGFNPAIKLLVIFTLSVLVIMTIILINTSI